MFFGDVRVKLQFGYNKRDDIYFRQGRFTQISEDAQNEKTVEICWITVWSNTAVTTTKVA